MRRTDQVLGSTRFDVVAGEDTPVTQKTLSEAMAKLLGTDLPAAMEAGFKKQNTSIADLIAKITPPVVVPPVVPPVVVPPVATGPIVGDPATNAKLLEYENRIKALNDTQTKEIDLRKAAETRAEQADLNSAIDRELAKYNFAKPESKFGAAKLITPEIVRNDKGELIAGNLPLADYVKNFLTVDNDYMLAPTTTTGGTGAGRGPSRPPGSKQVQIEDIKPGMTDKEYTEIAQQILAVLPSQNSSMSA